MSAVDRPAWLPEGWTMEVKTRRSGYKDRYYTCPLSGWTFRSKPEVMRHLSTRKVDDASEIASCIEDSKHQLAAQADNSLECLPSGWILETKIRMNGVSAGTKYKCYFDPFTGSRFYSKRQVFRHIKAHKHCSSTSAQGSSINDNSANCVCSPTDQKRSISANPIDNDCASNNNKKSIKTNSINNVKAMTEYSPNELPHGWIREVRIGKSNTRIRKDLVPSNKTYLPPIAAGRLKSAAKRCIFPQQQPLNARMPIEIADLLKWPSSPPLRHASAQSGEEGAETSCLTLVNIESHAIPTFHVEGIPGQWVEMGREQVSESAIKELPEPVSENLSKTLVQLEDEKLPVPDGKLLEEGHPELTKKQQPQTKKRRRGRLPSSNTTKATKAVSSGLGLRKSKTLKAIAMPIRASKRLAGVKAAPVTDIGIGDRSLRAKAKWSDKTQANQQKATAVIDLNPPGNPESKEPLVEQAAQGEQADPLMLSFADSWIDPCIEFAFKTLTGDFPDLEDTAAIQDYFTQQLISTQNPSPSGLAPLTFGVLESAQLEPQDDWCLPSFGDDSRVCSLENGKVNMGCHQKTGLNPR